MRFKVLENTLFFDQNKNKIDLLENLNTVKMILLEYPKSRRVQELLDIVDILHSNLETWLNKRQENNDDRE